MANPNLQLLTDAAKLLEPILGELVFVGGCATALLITDKAAVDVRPTFDVDAIAEITVGTAGGAAATSLLKGTLFQVKRADPIAFGGVAILLTLAAFLACYLPARNAAQIDPIQTLRSE